MSSVSLHEERTSVAIAARLSRNTSCAGLRPTILAHGAFRDLANHLPGSPD
jgi:hypothetical protein